MIPPTRHPRRARRPRRTSASARWSTTADPTPTTRAPRTSAYPIRLADDSFAYRGRWKLDYQGATADSDDSRIALKYNAKNVYIVAGGEGALTVTSNGKTTTVPISGAPTSHQLVSGDEVVRGELEVRLSKGLQAFSFTYG